ncbi:hypothetical protein LguiB_014068 [Lonicera macranthoides]
MVHSSLFDRWCSHLPLVVSLESQLHIAWSGFQIVAISHGRTGAVARAHGLLGLEPTVDVLNELPTANGGTIELLYMQAWSVPEVLRPLYESSTVLAHKTTMMIEEVMEADAVLWDVPQDGHQTLSAYVSDGYMVWLDSLLKYV